MSTKIDIQGHRGCRGLYPENSIPAFLNAIDLGVDTLEFDAVISKDLEVIISHEPYMSSSICLMPNGDDISKGNDLAQNIYTLNYEEIKSYDCGSKYYDKYPSQKKIPIHKPSLSDVVIAAEQANPKILYNIEIKRKVEWDNIYHPEYKQFADLVVNKINELGIQDRTTVQCFDIPTLQYIHKKYPDNALVFLIDNVIAPKANIDKLGFLPEVYSPNFKLVDELLVKFCKKFEMKLIPWTVNEENDIRKMIALGVHGIISDYPDRVLKIVKSA